jgi:hypothetical protein
VVEASKVLQSCAQKLRDLRTERKRPDDCGLWNQGCQYYFMRGNSLKVAYEGAARASKDWSDGMKRKNPQGKTSFWTFECLIQAMDSLSQELGNCQRVFSKTT